MKDGIVNKSITTPGSTVVEPSALCSPLLHELCLLCLTYLFLQHSLCGIC